MFSKKDRQEKMAFNQAILNTFGKLDQNDIQSIDGNIDRLLSNLMTRYNLSMDDAGVKLERFQARLTARNRYVLNTASKPVQV